MTTRRSTLIGLWPLIENDDVNFEATLNERVRGICRYPLCATCTKMGDDEGELGLLAASRGCFVLRTASRAFGEPSVLSTSIRGVGWLSIRSIIVPQPAWGNSRHKLQ